MTPRGSRQMGEDSFSEFKAYWKLAEELIDKATKEQLARPLERSLRRKYRELPLPALFELLKVTKLDSSQIGVLRDGTPALVGCSNRVMP
jgi:hypothetical protein